MICLLQLFREVRIMKYLDHPNIGEYFSGDACSNNKRILLRLPHLKGGFFPLSVLMSAFYAILTTSKEVRSLQSRKVGPPPLVNS